eukprot:7665929-Heterocapsa_arctica.AAC.1
MIEAIAGTIVRNNARDKAEREAKGKSENKHKRTVETAAGLDGADAFHMGDSEGRIEEDSPGIYGPEE